MIYKIAITGPESTGKSSLSKALAEHFNTIWVPEYARDFVDETGGEYKYEDIEFIARKQAQLEEEAMAKTNKILFCDTDALVTKVWSEFVFNKCSPWIEERYNQNTYQLYLLCDVDIEWQYDPLREHPNERQELFDIYHKHLSASNFNFAVVSGQNSERVSNAIQLVESFLKSI